MANKKQFTFLLALGCLLFCSPFLVYGQKPLSKWVDLKFITTDELKQLYDNKEDFLLVNTLSPIEFDEITIKGSINIPYDLIKRGEANLPKNKSKKLIFYCKGPKCTKSKKSASLAVKMGYSNVYAYNEGLPAWVKRGYPVEKRATYPRPEVPFVSPRELNAMIENNENVFIIDLRDADDRKAGYIKQSKNILMSDLHKRYLEIPKTKKIILLDLYGKQSYIAARFLASKSYKNIFRLDGGFVGGWIKAGLPIER